MLHNCYLFLVLTLQLIVLIFAVFKLAHHEERLMIMEQSLTTTQEQLSQRVAEVVRLEQSIRKLNTELKTMKERNASNEEEISEQKAMIEKLRKDLLAAKEETHLAIQEGMAYKQKSSKLEVELEGSREQERMLSDQVSDDRSINVLLLTHCVTSAVLPRLSLIAG